jgi:hypothetical protein
MRAALIYMHAVQGASKTIASGIDRQLSAAESTADDNGRRRPFWHVGGTPACPALGALAEDVRHSQLTSTGASWSW